MKHCRECQHEVSEQAFSCPGCGAPSPAKEKWNGRGFEYKSKMTLLGLPLLHICLKYHRNFKPVGAKGIIAIGQFAIGVVTISQFGVGIFSLGQFVFAGYALAQFCVFIKEGLGQFAISMQDLIGMLL